MDGRSTDFACPHGQPIPCLVTEVIWRIFTSRASIDCGRISCELHLPSRWWRAAIQLLAVTIALRLHYVTGLCRRDEQVSLRGDRWTENGSRRQDAVYYQFCRWATPQITEKHAASCHSAQATQKNNHNVKSLRSIGFFCWN